MDLPCEESAVSGKSLTPADFEGRGPSTNMAQKAATPKDRAGRDRGERWSTFLRSRRPKCLVLPETQGLVYHSPPAGIVNLDLLMRNAGTCLPGGQDP